MKTEVSIVGRSRIGLGGIVVAIGTVCLTSSACTTNSKYIPDDLVGEWKEPHGSLVLRADGTYRRVSYVVPTEGSFEVAGDKLVFTHIEKEIHPTAGVYYRSEEQSFFLSKNGRLLGVGVAFRDLQSPDLLGKWIFTRSDQLLGEDGNTMERGTRREEMEFRPGGDFRWSLETTGNSSRFERGVGRASGRGTFDADGDGYIRLEYGDGRGALLHNMENRALCWAGNCFTRADRDDSSSNRLPRLAPLGDRTVAADQTLLLDIAANNPDGDTLEFRVVGRPRDATFVPSGNSARFSWTPAQRDVRPDPYRISFHVSDRKGGSDMQTINVTVVNSPHPADGAPSFLGPFIYQLDPNTTDTLTFNVNVRDDDSARVTLRAIQNIEGARFESMGPKLATFTWRPTREQIAAQSVWFLSVGAKDEAHDEVTQDFTITIRR